MPAAPRADVTIHADHEAFVRGAAEVIIRLIETAVAANGICRLALAGGTTPRPVYERLGSPPWRDGIRWDGVHVFFGDERCVPPDDERSNYRMAHRALLGRVPIPPGQVHRIAGERDPADAARAYEEELRLSFPALPLPAFDLVCLGLGDDGHTASLFPGADSLHERVRWAAPQPVAPPGVARVTLTPPVLNAARNILFLVEGAGKAGVLKRVLEGPYAPEVLPAQVVRPTEGTVRWLVDAAAGAGLGLAGGR